MQDECKYILPQQLKVGFAGGCDVDQERLAFVVRQKPNGEWASEKSFNKWRNKEIEPKVFDNTPVEGFALITAGGGVKDRCGGNARMEYVRVMDPRGWVFEITVPNLLAIMQERACYPGKGLAGEFVYAWPAHPQGKLVLLPAGGEIHQAAQQFTELQQPAEDLELQGGEICLTKDGDTVIYLGRLKYYRNQIVNGSRIRDVGSNAGDTSVVVHVCWHGDLTNITDNMRKFKLSTGIRHIRKVVEPLDATTVTRLYNIWYDAPRGTEVSRLVFEKWEQQHQALAVTVIDGKKYTYSEHTLRVGDVTSRYLLFYGISADVVDGVLVVDYGHEFAKFIAFSPDIATDHNIVAKINMHKLPVVPWIPAGDRQQLTVVMGSGARYAFCFGIGGKIDG